MRYFSVFLVLLLLAGCQEKTQGKTEQKPEAATPATTEENIAETIGWLHGNCLAIDNANVPSGSKLTIVNFSDPPAILNGTTGEMADNGEDCYALMEDRQQINREQGTSFYRVESGGQEIELGIGLLDSIQLTLENSGSVTGDVNADGQPDFFTQCATSEGISFGVWDQAPYQGQPLWQGYYYMGYDMEPTCPLSEAE